MYIYILFKKPHYSLVSVDLVEAVYIKQVIAVMNIVIAFSFRISCGCTLCSVPQANVFEYRGAKI